MNRRMFLTALALTSASGLANSSVAFAGEDALTVVEAYMAAWNAHDSAAAAGHFSDGVVYFDASVGTPITGRDAAKTGVIDNFLHAAPDANWQIVGIPIVQEKLVAFEWTFSGTNSGDWSDGTAATGKPFNFTGASVFEVSDGLIVRQSDYYDSLGFYRQLGLI